MSKTPLECWIETNKGNSNFVNALVELLRFACVEWVRRTRGQILSKEEALSLFIVSQGEYAVGEWVVDPARFASEIADFCEKSKSLPLPAGISVEYPDVLDLRGVACPGNAVRSRLVMAGLPAGSRLKIMLDEGSPIENVPQALVADGHIVLSREKKTGFCEKKADFWEINVVKKDSML